MPRQAAPPTRMSRPQRLVAALAVLYVVGLLVTLVTLRFVGERWWVTTAALYLPRLGFAAPLPLVLLASLLVRLRRVFSLALASSVLILLALMGFVLPWPTSIDRGAPVVRVLSFNCDSAFGGADALVEEIDRFSPDIVLLQELPSPGNVAALLQARYPTIRTATQFLVASRFPITSSSDPDKLPFRDQMRSPRWLKQVIETSLGPIVVYNVHPISPREGLFAIRGNAGLKREILSGRVLSSSHADPIRNNAGLRALQVQNFAQSAMRETDPVIIAGDTNLPGLSVVLHDNLSGFQDAFSQAGWGFGYTFPTNHWPWMRIDRIMASAALRFVRFEVGTSLVSDHHCVVADVQRRSP